MTDRSQVTPLGPGVVDRGAYNYGGDPNAAANAANHMQSVADQAQNRQGEQINTGNADWDRGLSGSDRSGQLTMANMMAARASGQTPSIAQMQADRQMGQAAAAQTSAAASARGPAALALAQQGAAGNTAAMQSDISGQAQINGANERMQAEQAAFGAYSGMRGNDLSQQGQDFSQGAAQAQLNAAQRAQNDQFTLGNQQQGIAVQGMQLGADMNRDAAEQAGNFNAAGLQEQKNAAHDAGIMGKINAGIQGAAAVASTAAAVSDERAKVPVAWSASGGAAPIDTGYGTTSDEGVSMARLMAHQALNAQADRNASAAATSPAGISGGPMAVDMNPGKRWDQEDLGLIQAKKRNGVDLTAHEESSETSLRRRVGEDRAAATKTLDAKAPDAAATEKDKKDKERAAFGEHLKSSISGIGNALAAPAPAPAQGQAFRYVPAQQQQLMPMPALAPMTSDEDAKVSAGGKFAGALKGIGNALEKSAATDSEFHYAPPGRPGDSMMTSDEDTKAVVPLRDERDGRGEQHYDRDVSKSKTDAGGGASLSGPAPRFSMADRVAPKVDAAAPKTRKMTDAELEKYGRELQGSVKTQKDAQLGAGPSVGEPRKEVGTLGPEMDHGEMADAARSMRAVPYAYKPQFAGEEGQAPGEVNVGPVAQEMQKSPVAATAVTQDSPDGLRAIDIPKYTKVLGGIAASQQEQLDAQQRQISLMAQRLRSKR